MAVAGQPAESASESLDLEGPIEFAHPTRFPPGPAVV
jgi:hypothetical protein